MTTQRRLLRGLLRHFVSREFYRNTVVKADARVDAALDLLEYEEPTLLEWMTRGEGDQLLRAHTAAMTATILKSQQSGLPLEKVVHRLEGLTYRLMGAVAVESTMRARHDDLKGMVRDD